MLPAALLALLLASPVLSSPTSTNDPFRAIVTLIPRPQDPPICCLKPLPPIEPAVEEEVLLSFEEWKAKQSRLTKQEKSRKDKDSTNRSSTPGAAGEGVDSGSAIPPDSLLAPSDHGHSQDDNHQLENTEPISPHFRVPLTDRFNYASLDCSARVHTSHRSAKSPSSILSSKRDRYMLSPCKDEKFVVVELCEDIRIDTVQLANFEFFSGVFREFTVSVAKTYTEGWTVAGTYKAKNVRGVQSFHPPTSLRDFYRYIRIDFISHYGNEYYCPVSLLRVYGLTHLEQWKWEVWEAESRAKMEMDEIREARVDETREVLVEEPEVPSVVIIREVKEVVEETPDAHTAETSAGTPSNDTAEPILVKEETSPSPILVDHSNANANATVPTSTTSTLQSDIITTHHKNETSSPNNSPPSPSPSPDPSSVSSPSITSTLNPSPSQSHHEVDKVEISRADAFDASSSPESTVTSTSITTSTSTTTTTTTITNILPSPTPALSRLAVHSTTIVLASASASASASVSPSSIIPPPPVPPPPPPPHPPLPVVATGGGESIYRTIMNRLTALEANHTLYARYVEDQTAGIRDVLRRLGEDVGRLEGLGKAQGQMYARTLREWEKQRGSLDMEYSLLVSRVEYLADEIVLEKRLGIAQLCLLLAVLIFMGLTRGSRGESLHAPVRFNKSMREWGQRHLSISGDWMNPFKSRSRSPKSMTKPLTRMHILDSPSPEKKNDLNLPEMDTHTTNTSTEKPGGHLRNERLISRPRKGSSRSRAPSLLSPSPIIRNFNLNLQQSPVTPSKTPARPTASRSVSHTITQSGGAWSVGAPRGAKKWARTAHLHEVQRGYWTDGKVRSRSQVSGNRISSTLGMGNEVGDIFATPTGASRRNGYRNDGPDMQFDLPKGKGKAVEFPQSHLMSRPSGRGEVESDSWVDTDTSTDGSEPDVDVEDSDLNSDAGHEREADPWLQQTSFRAP